ncbi:MAG TPA: MEDS domain-containing protein [Burkholderiaceae bacterium]|nr:MEDS domain-containing protein [Burkholderiaceae bacterium]
MHTRSLMDQLSGHVKHGDHLCVVCDDPRERLEAAAQYLFDGLRNHEFVMYAADAETTGTLCRMLEERGLDVHHAIERGALSLPTAYDAYLRGGDFNPDAMYQEFDRAISTALASGYTGCRFAGEPVWAIERESLRPGLIEFETRLNQLFRHRKAAGLCVYDRRAWPAEVVRDVLRTHPIAVVGDLVCKKNFYYERADLVHDGSGAESQVGWMLSQLREVRTQEARLQIALEAGRLGSWELDLRTDSAVRSPRHDQIFGYEPAASEWGYERFMQHVLPEDRAHVDAAFRQAVETGTTWHFECRIRRHGDGQIRWIEAHGRPDPEGSRGERIEKLLGIVADITERKELEHALRQADRRKDEFLATLAHELRNPLAPIVNALQLMRLKGSEDPQLRRAQEVIDRQVKHLVHLVDDLLDVSRITTGRITLQRERLELRHVLANAIEASQPLIDSAGHRLTLDLPSEPLPLEGDATRLAQVFLNLLNNAAKYTPRGGRIEVSARLDGEQLEVRVKDNGIGIDSARIPDMFEMFVQGHRPGEHAQGGLGIGLPLARQLLELHGGSIQARSEGVGKGSEFVVRLPAAEPATAAAAKGPSTGPDASSGTRILVVDDNADAADILAENFRLLGHHVATSYTGREALDVLPKFQPEIAVLDIGLPDLDGYELARRIRRMCGPIVLVALTGWGQEKDRQLARDAGFDVHRTKPVDVAELLAAIEAVQASPSLKQIQ